MSVVIPFVMFCGCLYVGWNMLLNEVDSTRPDNKDYVNGAWNAFWELDDDVDEDEEYMMFFDR